MNEASFLGTGWSFPLRFDAMGVAMSSAEVDIEESLRILISTQPGERIMNPHFGCDLREYAFRPLNESTAEQIKDRISRAILFYEPRVMVEKITVVLEEDRIGKIRVEVAYVVNSTNTRHNLVFPYYLTEATDAII